MVGQAFAFAPNANKGAVSAGRIFQLLEKKPEIDSSFDYGITLVEKKSLKLFSFHKHLKPFLTSVTSSPKVLLVAWDFAQYPSRILPGQLLLCSEN